MQMEETWSKLAKEELIKTVAYQINVPPLSPNARA
jgi:hypothetical protein